MRRTVMMAVIATALLVCFTGIRTVRADAVYATDRKLFVERARGSGEAVKWLHASITQEQALSRLFPHVANSQASRYHHYLLQVQNMTRLMERLLLDQRISDQLQQEILLLEQNNGAAAAWPLLRRGLSGQERFLGTLSRTRCLLATCQTERHLLYLRGEPAP